MIFWRNVLLHLLMVMMVVSHGGDGDGGDDGGGDDGDDDEYDEEE